MMLASFVHTMDPVAIAIGPLAVRWYGLAYMAGFLIGWAILRWLARSGRTKLSADQVGDLLTWLVVGVIVGGRVGHVLLYEPALLLQFGGSFPWWGLLEIHKGGMSSHGGMVGVLVAAMLFARRSRVSVLHVFDLAAFAAPPGLMLGRLANWVNGELPGLPLPASMQAAPPWWSVKYPDEVFSPTFDISRLDSLSTLVDTSMVPLPNAVFNACMAGRTEVITRLEPMLTARWPLNFAQAATDGPLLMVIMVAAWWKPRSAGVVTAWFLIGYGLFRLLSERIREPDPSALNMGRFTTPMLMSSLMAALGAWLLWFILRRSARR